HMYLRVPVVPDEYFRILVRRRRWFLGIVFGLWLLPVLLLLGAGIARFGFMKAMERAGEAFGEAFGSILGFQIFSLTILCFGSGKIWGMLPRPNVQKFKPEYREVKEGNQIDAELQYESHESAEMGAVHLPLFNPSDNPRVWHKTKGQK